MVLMGCCVLFSCCFFICIVLYVFYKVCSVLSRLPFICLKCYYFTYKKGFWKIFWQMDIKYCRKNNDGNKLIWSWCLIPFYNEFEICLQISKLVNNLKFDSEYSINLNNNRTISFRVFFCVFFLLSSMIKTDTSTLKRYQRKLNQI